MDCLRDYQRKILCWSTILFLDYLVTNNSIFDMKSSITTHNHFLISFLYSLLHPRIQNKIFHLSRFSTLLHQLSLMPVCYFSKKKKKRCVHSSYSPLFVSICRWWCVKGNVNCISFGKKLQQKNRTRITHSLLQQCNRFLCNT